ncbi:aminotransferase class V-fold PLP-dependent enzyme [Aromatoleum toluvorans]|uniref:cysteine desulfurase n=1 Tax=Aromatoleum toluvorans TaxID=92002 RepID=A0ABX1PWQ5_9RHOO|nr:aminotransferase class V-fold PLP-dependent enzyme [Aromatoleum toluvorans]NMG43863.1 aminotransferase class V-fold PLP-dependent enzyme [Aromatoleum toluvorans]
MDARIYLDHNATTRPAPEVVAAMADCLAHCWGNPSSAHRLGAAAKERLKLARAQVAALLGAAAARIVFTASATEANHMAILGALAARPDKRHVVTSAVEHPASRLLFRHLESRGVRVTTLGVDTAGRLDLAALDAAIGDDTALLSLMWANNETGVLFPVAEIAAIARRRGVAFHCDAVQAAGRVPIDLAQLPVDLLTLSAHKFHGPKGIGALCVRKDLALPPLVFGHQERGRRGGTENLPAIVGFGIAAQLAARAATEDGPRIAALRDRLESGLRQRLPHTHIHGAAAGRLPNTSNLRFGTIDAEIVLDRLDRAGVCASSGSACAAGGTEPSPVLLAMGQTRAEALAALRFSLGRDTSAADIDRVLALLPDIVRPLSGAAA